MKPVINDAVPIFCRDNVPERIQKIVQDHFRIAGRAGRKIQQHRVFITCRSLANRPRKLRRAFFIFVVKTHPALACRADRYERFDCLWGRQSLFNFRLDKRIVVRHNHFDFSRVRPVFNVLLQKLVGRRNYNRPDSVQSSYQNPKLVPPAQNQHNRVAFFNTWRRKKIRRPLGLRWNLCKRKDFFPAVIIAPHKRTFFRIVPRIPVYNIVGKIEIIRRVHSAIRF